eukprot:CAMPEP_0205823986 /NCGR_PEP_ID=MMETSP0206-20130828/18915_1 /ASSEMBLY_ACC=CAM_ASM_000279 /TAXON_ID=36767 /ORGANISM="Euplotes focardii, Strain TN1" /LENGTH=149 /DNA_ID=CAMNT_0053121679 /DNA_START=50 /DNA_END=499 /DNA_ORIENTATION=-
MLVLTALLQMASTFALVCVALVALPTTWLMGNRGAAPEPRSKPLAALVGRMQRAIDNTQISLMWFAVLVFALNVSGESNATTAYLCQLFFFSKVAYNVSYSLGVPVVRTVVWAAGLAILIALAVPMLGIQLPAEMVSLKDQFPLPKIEL